MLTLYVGQALLCAGLQCWPALVGPMTYQFVGGTYEIVNRKVIEDGYGGDVLQFAENETTVYSIHRVWLGNPKQKRQLRLNSENARDRHITNGCVNVDPTVYDYLVSQRFSSLRVLP